MSPLDSISSLSAASCSLIWHFHLYLSLARHGKAAPSELQICWLQEIAFSALHFDRRTALQAEFVEVLPSGELQLSQSYLPVAAAIVAATAFKNSVPEAQGCVMALDIPPFQAAVVSPPLRT